MVGTIHHRIRENLGTGTGLRNVRPIKSVHDRLQDSGHIVSIIRKMFQMMLGIANPIGQTMNAELAARSIYTSNPEV